MRDFIGCPSLLAKLGEPSFAVVCPCQIRDPEEPAIARWIIDIPGRIDHHPPALVPSLHDRVNKPTVPAWRYHDQTGIDTQIVEHCGDQPRLIRAIASMLYHLHGGRAECRYKKIMMILIKTLVVINP